MSNVIDALVVELGLDPSKFTKGQKEAMEAFKKTQEEARKRANEIENRGKQTIEFFQRLRDQVIGLFAAFTAGKGLKEFITDLTDSDLATGRLAERIGMSVKQVATWKAAMQQFGGSADDVAGSLQALTNQVQDYVLTGTSDMIPVLRQLNLSLADLVDKTGNLHPDALIRIAQAVEKAGLSKPEAVNFLQRLGLGPDTINLLLQGSDAVRKLYNETGRLRLEEERDYKAAEARQKAWARFVTTAEALGRVIATQLTPILVSLTNKLQGVSDWFSEHPAELNLVFYTLITLVGLLSTAIAKQLIGSALRPLVGVLTVIVGTWLPRLFLLLATLTASILPGLADAFLAVGAAIEATPIGILIAGLAALGVGAYELYEHWTEIWEGMRKAVQKFVDYYNQVAPYLGLPQVQLPSPQTPGPSTGAGSGGPGADAFSAGPKSGPQAGKTGSAGRRASAYPVNPPSGAANGQVQSDIQALMRMGWSRDAAIGIAANLQRESGGNARAVGDHGVAFGLAQWHPDRQKLFEQLFGHDMQHSSRDEQLSFIDYELRHSRNKAGKQLANASSPGDAAAIFSRYFEAPANADKEANIRSILAGVIAGAPQSAIALSRVQPGSAQASNNHVNSEVHIGKIIVQTQATDADGIAQDLAPAIRRNTFAQQANYGPS